MASRSQRWLTICQNFHYSITSLPKNELKQYLIRLMWQLAACETTSRVPMWVLSARTRAVWVRLAVCSWHIITHAKTPTDWEERSAVFPVWQLPLYFCFKISLDQTYMKQGITVRYKYNHGFYLGTSVSQFFVSHSQTWEMTSIQLSPKVTPITRRPLHSVLDSIRPRREVG